MMRIGNVGIFVKDLEGAKAFFERYFDAKVNKTYNEEENSYYSYILDLGEGPQLELMTKPEIIDSPKHPNRTGFAHICIRVDTREKLNQVIVDFKNDGYEIQYEPSNPDGAGEVRAVTFEGNVLEVNYTPGRN